jgi:hypothetical protein
MFIIAGGIILALLFLGFLANPLGAIKINLGCFAAWCAFVSVLVFMNNHNHEHDDLLRMAVIAACVSGALAWLAREAENALARYRARKQNAQFRRQFKFCPSCAEAVKIQAAACRHCSHQFNEPALATAS